ncbi:zinc finger CCCH domain-containing protein 14-like [Cornus florida]|uniref:zinc finger CCCH domain-containing protein 14-like n=1 Tax=Cornus florida TaxID=4283 RepID=UPI00289FBE94|nr:zinc finger CCCH domain-containing protein 14-like [Cornus florida]
MGKKSSLAFWDTALERERLKWELKMGGLGMGQLIPLKANMSQSPSSSWSGGEKDNGSFSESEVERCVKEIRNEMEREVENRKMLKRKVKKMERLPTPTRNARSPLLVGLHALFCSTADAQMIKLGPNRATMYVASPPSILDDSYQPAFKTRLCSDYTTTKGCQFGEKCHFAHGICEFGKPFSLTFGESHRAMASGRFAGNLRLPFSRRPLNINNDPLTAQISVDASLAGAIYGHDDLKTTLCRLGVKIFIQDTSQVLISRTLSFRASFNSSRLRVLW